VRDLACLPLSIATVDYPASEEHESKIGHFKLSQAGRISRAQDEIATSAR
jgi:hypothetical protein